MVRKTERMIDVRFCPGSDRGCAAVQYVAKGHFRS